MADFTPKTEDFFRILNQVSDPLFILSPDFRFIWSNDAYCNYMDINPEKITSISLENVVPQEYIGVLKGKYNEINRETPIFDNIYPSVLKDGSIIIEKWHNEGIFDDDGNLSYYYSIAALKGTGDDSPLSLKDSDLISNTLIKSALLGIIIAIDNRIQFINPKAYEVLNLPPGTAFENQELTHVFKTIFPENFREIIGNETNTQAVNSEILIEKSGKKKWISVIRKYQLHNQIQTALLLFEDITDRKQNEIEIRDAKNKLSKIMRIARIGYWEKDFTNNRWLWSDEIYDIYGIPRGTAVTDDLISEHIDEASMKRRRARLEEVKNFNGDSYSYQMDYQIIQSNGIPKWVSGESFYERASNGSPERFYGWIQDVTIRKKIEETLRLARDKAEESERLKTAFLANMSHEIRTPLNAILGFSDLLTKSTIDAEQKKFKKIINQSSSLLLKIIDDILDISAIESGSFELIYENAKVNKIFEDIKQFYSDHEDSDIQLVIEKTTDDINLVGDQDRIKQVLINLINNAFKYTKKGLITVSCRKNKTINMAVFSVKDTGDGIRPELIDIIFDRFYQADSFSKGTGLGLAICKSIIERMGGNIRVNSAPGEGAEFIFNLPLKQKTARV